MQATGKRKLCAGICVACALISVFGFGGSKLKSRFDAVEDVFINGTDTTLATRHSMDEYLDGCSEHAVKLAQEAKQYIDDTALIDEVITLAGTLSEDDGISDKRYSAYTELTAAVEDLYSACQAAGAGDEAAVKTEYHDYLSRQDLIKHDGYYDYAHEYNDEIDAFPAGLIGSLWGATEAETFSR